MDEQRKERALGGLWILLGLALLAAAVLSSPTLLRWIGKLWGGPLESTLSRLPGARLRLLAGGAVIFAGRFILGRLGLFRWAAKRERRTGLFLMASILLVTFFGLEQLLSVRFYRDPVRETSIFSRDAERGWKLRPGCRERWGGVWATINTHGLRGAELPEPKTAGQLRLLFLGDSVTFGYLVEDDEPFPLLTGQLLGRQLPGRSVVPLNAGVGGYSPWQELNYLEQEGLGLSPDLVLVCFVLNDVTEKFSLVQFGGDQLGFQLQHTVEGLGDRLAGWSGIFACGAYLRDRIRFGNDPAGRAAGLERLQVMDLLYDEKRELVDQAWRLTLENLGKIFDRCREAKVPALLVSFPYAFQLENPRGYGRPQRVLGNWAEEQGVELLDLLPLLRADLDARGRAIGRYFLDDNHLSPEGHQAVARVLAERIHDQLQPAPPVP